MREEGDRCTRMTFGESCFISLRKEGVQVGPGVLRGEFDFPRGTRRGDRVVPVPIRCRPSACS